MIGLMRKIRRSLRSENGLPPLPKGPPWLGQVMGIDGQITAQEALKLAELAAAVPAGAVTVEIGSYRGRSAAALAFGARQGNGGRVYAIDPHTEFIGPKGGHYGPPDQAALYRHLTELGVGDLVAVLSLPSTQVAQSWVERNVGLLWIDGNHRYEAVKADAVLWYPHVIAKGIIAFHDSEFPDVARAIDEVKREYGLTYLGRLDALTWLRKE